MPLPNEILEQLPEELRENPTLNNYNSLEDLAKGFVETKAMVGNSLRVPGEEASAEQRNEFINKLINHAPEVMLKPNFEDPEQGIEFYKVLGMPDAMDGYENPEGVQLPPESEASLREALHAAKLTNKQYQEVVSRFAKVRDKGVEDATTKYKEDRDKLKGEWGMTTEERMEAARRANDEFFPGRDFDQLTSAEIKGLFNIAKAVTGKGAHVSLQPPENSGLLPPQEALERAEAILDRVFKEKDLTQAQVNKLMQKHTEYLKMAGYVDTLDGLRA